MPQVTLQVDDAVATITLDQPARLNAMTLPMWQAFRGLLEEVADSSEIRALVLTGAGENFCSGMDVVGSAVEAHPMRRLQVTNRAVLALHNLRVPTIARLDGVAVGAGANLALGCDLVIASNRARLSQIFTHRALSVDSGGSWILPRLIGLHRAKELCFLGDMISAERARELGLYANVVPAAELDEAVAELAARLAAAPPVALQQTKRLLNEGYSATFEQALESELRSQSTNLQGEDSAEAFDAFRTKRTPTFTGGGYRNNAPSLRTEIG
ncbi:enoyl-CoA hydratase/isomerase family protein [Rhodococcus pseudokoreensis]|uniref:Enoyl-CoA hydratase/isomerase family protein n=1 Tax=Rhodococcus pseudokoreensis TaxID=2811421 RepID=A0A974ZUD5_9NOCA|nr:enoyl-CoA hydratase-related protein [Rhodococcus pseudokoreensis]QSE90805.1 enoyl-CoA hydratase/isomerase family protein [Rhodococcus pseudokoreensis]